MVVAAVTPMTALGAQAASARPEALCTTGFEPLRGSWSMEPSRCVFHERGRPIIDNYMVGLEQIEWVHWGATALGHGVSGAAGVGEVEVTVRLSAPRRICGHLAFTLAQFRYQGESTFRAHVQIDTRLPGCAPAPPRRYFLGTEHAARLMRAALRRKFGSSFAGGFSKQVVCNHRIGRDRLRCKMTWFTGDSAFGGRGQIWVAYQSGRPTWNYEFKMAELNEYCVVTGGSHCLHWHIAR
jgi:hypothetical protein